MTVESNLFDVLKALLTPSADGTHRVFPDEAPNGTPTPYIVYQQVGGEAPIFLERAVPSKMNGRIQVNVWDLERTVAKALGIQIEAALVAATTFQAKPLGALISLTDEETRLRGSSQDFTVWSDR